MTEKTMTDEQIIKAFEEVAGDNHISITHQIICCDALRLLRRYKAEIDELKRKFDDEKWLRNLYSRKSKYLENALEAEKAEAIKNFAERLCKGRVENDPIVIAVRNDPIVIKAELKQMTEADK